MDEYWKKIGDEIAKKKRENLLAEKRKITNHQKKLQHKLDSEYGNHKYAKQNKRRWPRGVSNVFNLLLELKIRFTREKIVGMLGTFRQPDFAIPKLKVFLEIDGPEHTQRKDTLRETQILSRPVYRDWRFFRVPSDIAADREKALIALRPIIEEWSKQ